MSEGVTAVSMALEAAPERHRPFLALLKLSLKLWRTRIGLTFVVLLVALAVIGPIFSPYAPTAFVGSPNQPPTDAAVLGTDYFGQDVLSRFLWGGRSVLALAGLSTLLGVLLGTAAGLAAALSRHALDEILMRGMDILLAFPQIMLALVVIAMFGAKAWLLVLVVGISTMPRVARVARGAALPFVERDFVLAAEALGETRRHILFREVLPNVVSPLAVEATLRLTYSIAIIAGLAFLGFTTTPNGADWGKMIQENQGSLTTQPWATVMPIVAIALLTVGTSMVADGFARTMIGIEHRRASG